MSRRKNNEQKMLCISCTENLSLIPQAGGIVSNAEIPVTVYLKGVLDGGRICGYSFLHHGKSLQTKPVLQFGTHIRPDYSVVWNKHRHSAGVFSFLTCISERYPTVVPPVVRVLPLTINGFFFKIYCPKNEDRNLLCYFARTPNARMSHICIEIRMAIHSIEAATS